MNGDIREQKTPNSESIREQAPNIQHRMLKSWLPGFLIRLFRTASRVRTRTCCGELCAPALPDVCASVAMTKAPHPGRVKTRIIIFKRFLRAVAVALRRSLSCLLTDHCSYLGFILFRAVVTLKSYSHD
jgi:hypothetical protein